MKNIHCLGINHTTASIDVREKFYLNDTQQDLLLSELKNNPAIFEAFCLSTCNRTEIYVHVIDEYNPFEHIYQLLCNIKQLNLGHDLINSFYFYTSEDAVKHLFTVTAGLDSLILGERQILGQVKEAVAKARNRAMFDKRFNILMNLAIRAGKKAQSETKISFGGSSVSWAAIVKAEGELGSIAEKEVLIIGAGEMSKLAVGALKSKDFKKPYLMNRTHAHAVNIAQKLGGEPVAFCDIKDILSKIDVCICASSAPHYILEESTLEKIMPNRAGKKLIIIDISMPRNVDPQVKNVHGVKLFAIDDLKEVVDKNIKKREKAIAEVKSIIENKLKEYYRKINSSFLDQPQLRV